MIFERQQRLHETLPARSRILTAIRSFFIENRFMEVETPICIPAPVPEPHIDALETDCGYLQTSPEIYMKQLLAAGFEKLFQICKCFRRFERGSRHLPEFTMLEWYDAGQPYTAPMHTCEAMVERIVSELQIPLNLSFHKNAIDLSPPWPRLSVSEAFARYGSADMETAVRNNTFDEIMGLEIEPHLGTRKPVFLYDYPAETSPRAAPKSENPEIAQRFELYIAGLEICNGCAEQTDPDIQSARFEEEIDRRRRTGLPVYPLPGQFLEALCLMPNAAGCALGIDRLIMLFTDSSTIDEVVAFTPQPL